MKKLSIVIITVTLFIALSAVDHAPHSDGAFSEYQTNPNFQNFQKAATEFNTAIEADTKDVDSRMMQANLYNMELDRSLNYFAANLDSLDTRTKFSYANLLLSLNRPDECIPIYEQLNSAIPKWACPWRHKGEALLKSGKWEAAELATQQSVNVRPDHYDAYVQLAEIQKHLGKNAEALGAIEKALELMTVNGEEDVTDNHVYQLYIDILKLNDQPEKATEIEKLLK